MPVSLHLLALVKSCFCPSGISSDRQADVDAMEQQTDQINKECQVTLAKANACFAKPVGRQWHTGARVLDPVTQAKLDCIVKTYSGTVEECRIRMMRARLKRRAVEQRGLKVYQNPAYDARVVR